jgi:Zn-ribbon protein, possibly nucleic acid-binding
MIEYDANQMVNKTNGEKIIMEHLKTLVVGFLLVAVGLIGLSSVILRQGQALSDQINTATQETEDLRTEISSLTDAYEAETASLTDALEELKEEIKVIEESTTEEISTEEITTEESTEEVSPQDTPQDTPHDDTKETSKDETKTLVSSAMETTQLDDGETIISDETNNEYTVEVEEMYKFDEYYQPTDSGNSYGDLSETDIYYLQRVAETETYGTDMMSKTHVVSVVLNRWQAGTWGSSVQAVVTSPNQFCYFRTSISQSTIDAVNYVLENGDTAQGAMYFHSGAYSSTFCGRSWIFSDDCGHHFY